MTKAILFSLTVSLLSINCGYAFAGSRPATKKNGKHQWELKYQIVGLSQKETDEVTRATEWMRTIIPKWSWMENITGPHRFVIAHSSMGQGLPADVEAVPIGDESGVFLLVFWDTISKVSVSPFVTLLEHSAMHLYLAKHLGSNPEVNSEVLGQLRVQALFSVLSDMRRPDVLS